MCIRDSRNCGWRSDRDSITPSEVSRNSRKFFLNVARGHLLGLPQLLRQILRLQVGVPSQHTQILVPGDARDLHDIQPFLEQPSGGLVAQVVEAEVFDSGPSGCPHVGTLHGLGGDAGEHIAVQTAGQVALNSMKAVLLC